MRISPLLQSINQCIVAWLVIVDGGVIVVVVADRRSRFLLATGRGGRMVAIAPNPPVSPPSPNRGVTSLPDNDPATGPLSLISQNVGPLR